MQSENIKRFIDCFVPVKTCNLRCPYCYITQQREFDTALPDFPYSAEHIAKCLSRERLGGTCVLNLCGGGETLLPPQITRIVEEILKQGHYVMVVTNGTVRRRLDELCGLPNELLSRLLIKFSYHYLELIRAKRLDAFFDNIDKVRRAGCSFSLELTPHDELIPHLDELKALAIQKVGAPCHVIVARDNSKQELPMLTSHSREDYRAIWGQFDSELFGYKLGVFGQKRKEFCYAGDWVCFLDIRSGKLMQCYAGDVLQNIYEDPDEPIRFRAIGCHCRKTHCYNAHAWLTFGAIPSLQTPTYAAMRNRVCADGSEWLTPGVKAFLSTKLIGANREYSGFKKLRVELRHHITQLPLRIRSLLKK